MPREFARKHRIAAEMQRLLNELLLSEVKDPRLAGARVSEVEVTRRSEPRDHLLQHARARRRSGADQGRLRAGARLLSQQSGWRAAAAPRAGAAVPPRHDARGAPRTCSGSSTKPATAVDRLNSAAGLVPSARARGRDVFGLLLLDKPAGVIVEPRAAAGEIPVSGLSAQGTPAASIRLRRACCRSCSGPARVFAAICSTRARSTARRPCSGSRLTTGDAEGDVTVDRSGEPPPSPEAVAGALRTIRRRDQPGAADVFGAEARRRAAVSARQTRGRGRTRAAARGHRLVGARGIPLAALGADRQVFEGDLHPDAGRGHRRGARHRGTRGAAAPPGRAAVRGPADAHARQPAGGGRRRRTGCAGALPARTGSGAVRTGRRSRSTRRSATRLGQGQAVAAEPGWPLGEVRVYAPKHGGSSHSAPSPRRAGWSRNGFFAVNCLERHRIFRYDAPLP